MFACRSGSKYSCGRRGSPEWRSASKYSSGRPAMPVWSSRSHRSVLPLRGVAQTRYERVGMVTGGSESIGSVELFFGCAGLVRMRDDGRSVRRALALDALTVARGRPPAVKRFRGGVVAAVGR